MKDGESKEGATLQGSFKPLLPTVSESLKTLAVEEAPYPDEAETSDTSLSSFIKHLSFKEDPTHSLPSWLLVGTIQI